MATFTWAIDYGSQEQHQPRIRTVRFGDGYQQRSADGINTDAAVWSVTMANRSDAEAGLILAFLAARAGLENFDWTPPGWASAGKFTCQEWAKSPTNFGATTITARFTQVFEA